MKNIWKLSILVVVLFAFVACSNESPPTEKPINQVEISDEAVVMTTEQKQQIVAVEENRILIEGTQPEYKSGDVLVNDEGEAFLRRVKEVKPIQNTNRYEIITEPASVEQVITDGTIRFDFPISLALDEQALETQGVKGFTVKNNVLYMEAFELDRLEKIDVLVSGKVAPVANFYIDAEFKRGKLVSFETGVKGGVEVELKAELIYRVIEKMTFTKRIDAFTVIKFTSAVTSPTGKALNVPVKLQPFVIMGFHTSSQETLVIEDSLELKATSTATIKGTVKAGIEYKDKKWDYVSSASLNTDISPFDIDLGISVDKNRVAARVTAEVGYGISFFGESGLDLRVGPYAEAGINFESPPTWDFKIGLDGSINLKLGLNIWKFKIIDVDLRYVVFDKVLKKWDGIITIAPVKIPDNELQKAIRAALNKPNGVILVRDMQKLTNLNVAEKCIYNLQGLETATNLASLDISKTHISSASLKFLIDNKGFASGDTLKMTGVGSYDDFAGAIALVALKGAKIQYDPVIYFYYGESANLPVGTSTTLSFNLVLGPIREPCAPWNVSEHYFDFLREPTVAPEGPKITDFTHTCASGNLVGNDKVIITTPARVPRVCRVEIKVRNGAETKSSIYNLTTTFSQP